MVIKLNPKAILLAKLTEEEFGDLANFDCADAAMNEFLKSEAFNEQELGMNYTTLLYYEGELAGFYSICTDSMYTGKGRTTLSMRYDIYSEVF